LIPSGLSSVTNLFGGALGVDVDASIAAGELGREDEVDELDDEPKPRKPMAAWVVCARRMKPQSVEGQRT